MKTTLASLFVATIILPLLAAEPAEVPVAGFHGAGALVGKAEDIAGPPMKVKWTYKCAEEGRCSVEGSPVIAGDTAYVADGLGGLHAIKLSDGTARWVFRSEDGFAATPLIAGGKVYIGDLAGTFFAIDADTGKAAWQIKGDSPIHASANISGDRILYATDGADLICVTIDGKPVWKRQAGDRIVSAPSIANGLAFFSGCDSQLRAIEIATGKEKFAADLGAPCPSSPVFAGDRILAGTDGGRVIALSADGKKTLWIYEGVQGGEVVTSSPAVSDGIVVVGAHDRQIHAISLAEGKGLWTFQTRGEVDGSAVISAGRVYATSKDRRLYVLDLKTGNRLWDFISARSLDGGPAVGSGVVVIADSGGNVTCLEPAGK